MFGSAKNSKKSGSGAPKFFCENCGTEVPMDEKKCPQCGRYFASVRCPACGFIGDDDMFKGGCPICGYSSAANNTGTSGSPGNFTEGKKLAGALPIWVYFLTVAVFAAIAAALFITVFK